MRYCDDDRRFPWWLEPLRNARYRLELLPAEQRHRIVSAAWSIGIYLAPGGPCWPMAKKRDPIRYLAARMMEILPAVI